MVSADLSRVLQASANIERFLGLNVNSVLGKPLSAVVGPANAQKILDLRLGGESQPSVPTLFQLENLGSMTEFVAEVHRVRDDWVIELEPGDDVERQHFASLFVSIRNALWDADAEHDLTEYCNILVDQVRVLSEFDRVMVYRFDQDWNGEVIAESRNDRLPSLLGNHFPASDIPLQARDLYIRNLFRALADTDAPTVELEPSVHPLTGDALDMSYATLRSMSPVHIEYLRNMKARSSMSISLIVDGKLWGLIACHNKSPHHVTFDVRGLALLVGTNASLKLANLESNARSKYLANVQKTLLNVTQHISQSQTPEQALAIAQWEIRELFNASGSVICLNGTRYAFGEVPTEQEVDDLVIWLKDHAETDVFFSECLQNDYPPAKAYASRAAGLLAVRLDYGFNNFAFWFRAEIVRSIRWAGDPQKSLVNTSEGWRIEPRRSFAQWIEEQRGHAAAWTSVEVESAQPFMLVLSEVLTQSALRSKSEDTEARLKFLADHDHLTGLPNRRWLTDKLQAAVADAAANQRDLAILFIDLDHFKSVNDKLGHFAGDRYLQEVAQRLRANLRHADTLARWGGDEFVAVIEQIRPQESLDDAATRLQTCLIEPMRLDGHQITPSASIGVARFPRDGTTGFQLIRAADSAMYRAKQKNRNSRGFDSHKSDEAKGVSLEWHGPPQHGLTSGELTLHYQPQFRTEDGSLAGLEVLLRWNHTELGISGPQLVSPTQVDVGLTPEVSDWLLQRVCRQIADWQSIMPPATVIALNIAPAELATDFAERAVQAINTAGIAAQSLAFEVTEAALEHRHSVVPILQECTDAGIRLTIDEFGSGYMSLAQLRDLSVSCFKLDRQFIDGAFEDERDVAIVRSVVTLAAGLGISTAAQGVETKKQLEFLRAERVDVVQGSFLGSPIPEERISAFLAGHADGTTSPIPWRKSVRER